jgi:hypothetical protein
MFKKIFALLPIIFFINKVSAQDDAQMYMTYKPEGEFGIAAGLDHYFGDLNTSGSLRKPKFTAGSYYIKELNDYVGIRVSMNYAFLAYSDIYSSNPVERRRNLSFNDNIWELAAAGYFNFFRYIPGVEGYKFTPYVALGVGAFTYDPYAYLNGQKYFLRPLGTEGQGSAQYPGRKPYGTTALCFPLTVGIKYSITANTNFFVEVGYRFTTTDYIDDVSTTYAGINNSNFYTKGVPNAAYYLQDRSYETGPTRIGIAGRQRGNSSQDDSYVLAQIGLSFNLSSYRCPKVK